MLTGLLIFILLLLCGLVFVAMFHDAQPVVEERIDTSGLPAIVARNAAPHAAARVPRRGHQGPAGRRDTPRQQRNPRRWLMGTKTCVKCGILQDSERDFHWHSRALRTRRSECKDCARHFTYRHNRWPEHAGARQFAR